MHSKRVGPIITSLLDTDFYKFTMGQLIFRDYPGVEVTFSLINRSKAPLARYISEEDLRRELDCVRNLRFNNSELHYLRGTNEYGGRMFGEDYLTFLKGMTLPPYNLTRIGDDYKLEFSGAWPAVMLWEVPALAIVNELYFRGQLKTMSRVERDAIHATGTLLLLDKIKKLREYPEITFSDFGTRRRFSSTKHDYIIGVLAEELPKQLRGTSNVFLAMKHGLLPMGTSAHELPMIIGALWLGKAHEKNISDEEALVSAQSEVLFRWDKLYGNALSIALTDTFGSDFFFRTVSRHIARGWKGTRQDSGDPFVYGEKVITWYEKCTIRPQSKFIVFSDQLNVPLAVRLHKYFHKRIGCTFGIGTNLTNDVALTPISIVIKATKANGNETVKLSDNVAKAMGDPTEIERYKRAVAYINTVSVKCVS